MNENKRKFGLWVHPETLKKVDSTYKEDNCKSRSEFIENAINFYCGYIKSNQCLDYYPEVIVSSVKGVLDGFEDRMASLLFKNAVEQSMLMHIAAANFRIDENVLSRLRGKCVDDVKKLHGRISFEDVVKYQKGG